MSNQYYSPFIQQVLSDFAQRHQSRSELELQTIFDIHHDRYQLLCIGWQNKRRVFTPLIHFEIKDSKIWLQLNATEEDPTVELIKLGVPKEDIILGFHSPFMHQSWDQAYADGLDEDEKMTLKKRVANKND